MDTINPIIFDTFLSSQEYAYHLFAESQPRDLQIVEQRENCEAVYEINEGFIHHCAKMCF